MSATRTETSESTLVGAESLSVSVLLPAWNEARMLGRCLDSLLAIDLPGLEIILCAGGSDGTFDTGERYAAANSDRIVLLRQEPGEGKQAALRRCFARSRGEILYFTDADCVVPISAFEQVIGVVASGLADAATGPADPLPEQRESAWIRHQWAANRAVDRHRGPDSTGILGRNFAARRDVVAAAGGFRDPVPIGTDYHFAKLLLRQGRTIRYVEAPVQTHFIEEIAPFLRQQSRWLRNIFVHGPHFAAHRELVACARSVGLGTALLLWPLTWRWNRWRGVALWCLAIGWMARQRVRYGQELDAEMGLLPATRRRLVTNALAFSLIDLVAWAMPFVDTLIRGRRLKW